MIDRTEIIRLAGELGLLPRVVEKDYVLGWVLAGIARDEELSRTWLFKGGHLSQEMLLRDLPAFRRPRFHGGGTGPARQ